MHCIEIAFLLSLSLGCKAQVVADPCAAPAKNSSVELANWAACAVTRFYPYPANGNWIAAYNEVFSPNVLASFNTTRYDFNGLRSFYQRLNATIAAGITKWDWGFRDIVAVPRYGDKGGTVYITGWQSGLTVVGTYIQGTDALFAVVEDIGGGVRKIVEMRESSNTPSSIPAGEGQEWTCALPTQQSYQATKMCDIFTSSNRSQYYN